MDGVGNVYVVGGTHGSLPGQISSGQAHVFVREYDADGQEVWTRQIGTSELDVRGDVAVDRTGNVYMAGHTLGALPGQTHLGGGDVFVRKYDPDGQEVWTRQFGTSEVDVLGDVAVDGSGNLYVAGHTRGALPGQTSLGESDIFVRKYDADGQEVWTRQFGTFTSDHASGVAMDGAGNVYVVGGTHGALPDQASLGESDVFVRQYDADGQEVWTRQFGTSSIDVASGVAMDGAGNVYVAGHTQGALPGQTSLGGGDDVFLIKLSSLSRPIPTPMPHGPSH